MTAGAAGVLLLLVAAVVGTATAQEGEAAVAGTTAAAAAVGTDTAQEGEAAVASTTAQEDEVGRVFVGSYQTTTYTEVVVSTSTVFLSCLSGSSNTLCAGRRRKRTVSIPLTDDAPGDGVSSSSSSVALDSSSGGDEDLGSDRNSADGDLGEKSAFTVWTTTKTTTSVTVFYTNTSSTVRLSYMCLAGGVNLPSLNCVGA